VILVYSPCDEPRARIAVVASKAIGNAVTRNLVKRRLKSCLAPLTATIKVSTDLIFYARRGIVHAGFTEICLAITDLLNKADLLEN
jgi:ribonuclease P protein component